MPIASNAIAVSAIASRPQAGAALSPVSGGDGDISQIYKISRQPVCSRTSANRITQVRADAETQATANNATRQTVSCCR